MFENKIKSMKKVLKRLDFVDNEDVPTAKGKIAALIFGADELLITELLFSGKLRKLSSL